MQTTTFTRSLCHQKCHHPEWKETMTAEERRRLYVMLFNSKQERNTETCYNMDKIPGEVEDISHKGPYMVWLHIYEMSRIGNNPQQQKNRWLPRPGWEKMQSDFYWVWGFVLGIKMPWNCANGCTILSTYIKHWTVSFNSYELYLKKVLI